MLSASFRHFVAEYGLIFFIRIKKNQGISFLRFFPALG